jgi:hypothetical protein
MYGIHQYDIDYANEKLTKQKDFLENNSILTSNGTVKSLMECSYSANISKRYYAELTNRVNTINSINFNLDNEAHFLTITLDGFYRDLLQGDYSRLGDTIPKRLPYIQKRKIELKQALTIKDLVQILTHHWKGFISSAVFRDIKKAGYKHSYIRVFEPHKKDGVPHIHALLYFPAHYKSRMMKSFFKYFPAPQNARKIDNGQYQGFQWDLHNASGYVMKYLQKTFMDIKEDKELDELQTWYIVHKIRRVTISHTLIPAWVYRKIFFLDSDWHFLTEAKLNSFCEWSAEKDYFIIQTPVKTYEYYKGQYTIYYSSRLGIRRLKQFGEIKEDKEKITYKVKLSYKKKQKPIDIIVEDIDGNREEYFYNDHLIKKSSMTKPINTYSDQSLYEYFNFLDIETVNLHHYGVVRNEMIDRGLLQGYTHSIDSYADFDIFGLDILSYGAGA